MANNDPVEFRLFDTDLTTTLGILPGVSMKLYLPLNEPGSGEVVIPLDSQAAGQAASGMFAENRYRGGVRGGFFVENISKDEAGSGEGQARRMTLSGRGALAILDEAIVWDDGSDASTRDFTGTRASILIALIVEAQSRGGLQNLSYDFTNTLDSDAQAWTDNETLSFAVGTKLLDVARQIAKVGIDFTATPDGLGGFILSAYKDGIGNDKSETIYFRVGVNCEEVSDLEAGGADLRNVLKAKYNGGFTIVKDDASVTAHRRREALFDVSFTASAESASTFASAELEAKKNPKHQISLRIYDGVGPRAFIEYDLGDRITLDNQGVETDYRIRGLQLTWDGDKLADIVVDLNSLVLENDMKVAQDVEWLKTIWQTARDANLLETRSWVALGLPTDSLSPLNSITDIYVEGNLAYIVGSFDTLGGIEANNIAVYDMTSGRFSALGGGVSVSGLRGVTVLNGNVYVVGDTSNIWRWDGSTWTVIGSADFLESLFCVTNDGTYIYVGGDQSSIDGDTNKRGVAKYDPDTDTWYALGAGLVGIVYALLWDGSNLIAGGIITGNVRIWDGSGWATLGSGLDGTVRALAKLGTAIIAGGEQPGYLSQYETATDWVTISGIDDIVRGLGVYLADLYVVGDFVKGIKKLSGGYWYDLAEGLDNDALTVAFYNTTVIVGGEFATAGTVAANKLAAYFTDFQALVNQLSNNGSSYDLGAGIHGATAVTTPLDADEFPLWKSSVQLLRKVTWANIKATLKTYFDTLYFTLAKMLVGEDQVAVGDGSGGLIGDDLFRWDASLRSIRHGPEASVFNFSDVFPLAMVAKNADEVLYLPLYTYGTSAGGGPAPGYRTYRSRGTYTTPTALLLDDVLRNDRALGHDGSDFFSGYQFELVTSEGWSGTNRGTKLRVYLVKTGEATRTVAYEIFDGKLWMADGGRVSADNGLAFMRKLDRNLVLQDGEVLVTNYIEFGTYDVTFEGDGEVLFL